MTAFDVLPDAATPPPRSRGPVLDLVERGVVLAEEWEELPAATQADLRAIPTSAAALDALVQRHLLTRFQADMVRRGLAAELLIGHYRLVEPLGRGGMGVVYRGEHRYLRRPVAIKVLADRLNGNARLIDRFSLEARVVARLQHPNIVSCLDAGRDPPRPPAGGAREYFVMDLVPGADLQQTVSVNGPLPVHRAASLFLQVAEALAEAHRAGLVHRDIKPSNIFVTPDWKAKVLDFGLARHPSRDMTEPGALVGTVGYMAPEQARDARTVDGRADVFGLGASLFLALTGVEPFYSEASIIAELNRRQTAPPPRVRAHDRDLPVELDDLVAKLMDPDPERRFPSATAAASALVPFTRWRPDPVAVWVEDELPKPRVLIVDDDPDVRVYIRSLLEPEHACTEATDGRDGLALVESERFDLVVVDQEMPRLDGARLIARMLQASAGPPPMVLYMSGRVPTESLGGLLLAGADDFIRKPFGPPEFLSRVRGLLNRRSTAQPPDPAPKAVVAAADPVELLAQASCQLLEEVGVLGRGYHDRLPQYVRALAGAVHGEEGYGHLGDPARVGELARAAACHDLGNFVVPADILAKPGRLDADERLAVQAHAPAGGQLLAGLTAAHPDAAGLTVAAEVARHHHERWDGTGYPDGLAGEDIPVAARVVALASVYDALRCRRPYRPGLSHPRAVRLIVSESVGQFDPVLVGAFALVADQFDRVFQSAVR